MKRPRLSERDNYRHWTLYNSNNFYGMSPERYEEITAGLQEEIDDPLIYDPETDTKIPKTPEQAAHQQEMLDGWKKDKELINRMHQPMGTFMSSSWKDDDGDYTSSKSHKKGLEDPAGGSFKDALLGMNPNQYRDWLNNNYGGRGLGYMGQNAYPSIPMAQRKQLVQQNAKPALIRQLARMNRPKTPPYGGGLYQLGKLPWQ